MKLNLCEDDLENERLGITEVDFSKFHKRVQAAIVAVGEASYSCLGQTKIIHPPTDTEKAIAIGQAVAEMGKAATDSARCLSRPFGVYLDDSDFAVLDGKDPPPVDPRLLRWPPELDALAAILRSPGPDDSDHPV